MDERSHRGEAATDRWEGARGLTRRAIIATIALWMLVLVGLYIAMQIVRSPAVVA
jgi:hypothetical protein